MICNKHMLTILLHWTAEKCSLGSKL